MSGEIVSLKVSGNIYSETGEAKKPTGLGPVGLKKLQQEKLIKVPLADSSGRR